MATYDDDVITLDEIGITVKNYHLPGRPRLIRYDDGDLACEEDRRW